MLLFETVYPELLTTHLPELSGRYNT